MNGCSLHNPIAGLCMHLYLACNGPDIAPVPGSVVVVKHPEMPPFMDVLHFVSIRMYPSVINDMTKAFQSL